MNETASEILKGGALVPAFRRDDVEGFRMWCMYCRAWHLHGKGAGHRGAHCVDIDRNRRVNSGYRQGGYILVDCGPLPPQFRMRGGKLRTNYRQVEPLLAAWIDAHPNWLAGYTAGQQP